MALARELAVAPCWSGIWISLPPGLPPADMTCRAGESRGQGGAGLVRVQVGLGDSSNFDRDFDFSVELSQN